MEHLNQKATVAHSFNSTRNDLVPNQEEAAVLPFLTTIDNNDVAPEFIAREGSVAAGPKQRVRRGRGRPQNCNTDGSQMPPIVIQPFGGDDVKRERGRPRGSGKQEVLASIGGLVGETVLRRGFTPYVVTVNPGEDMISKLASSYQGGPLEICVLSANGPASSVTIRERDSPNPLRYEGQFEILGLTGSYTNNWLFNVILAKPDGTVFGGKIESSLIAAGPIQLVLATFQKRITKKTKKRKTTGSSNALNMLGNPDSETTNAVLENAILADQNMHPESVIGVNPEYLTMQPDADVDHDANAP